MILKRMAWPWSNNNLFTKWAADQIWLAADPCSISKELKKHDTVTKYKIGTFNSKVFNKVWESGEDGEKSEVSGALGSQPTDESMQNFAGGRTHTQNDTPQWFYLLFMCLLALLSLSFLWHLSIRTLKTVMTAYIFYTVAEKYRNLDNVLKGASAPPSPPPPPSPYLPNPVPRVMSVVSLFP